MGELPLSRVDELPLSECPMSPLPHSDLPWNLKNTLSRSTNFPFLFICYLQDWTKKIIIFGTDTNHRIRAGHDFCRKGHLLRQDSLFVGRKGHRIGKDTRKDTNCVCVCVCVCVCARARTLLNVMSNSDILQSMRHTPYKCV